MARKLSPAMREALVVVDRRSRGKGAQGVDFGNPQRDAGIAFTTLQALRDRGYLTVGTSNFGRGSAFRVTKEGRKVAETLATE